MRRFLQIALVLLLLVVGGGSWYLYRKGFSRSWRELVVNELREHGVEVSFATLTVEPFRGIIARDVKLYASRERKQVLAQINELVVEGNYARAARRQPFLEALTLVDASLRLPIDSKKPDGPAITVEKLNTRILLQPDQVLVSRLEAQVAGIHVSASGQLSNPGEFGPPPSPPKPTSDQPSALLRVLAELDQLRYDGAPPRLEVRFGGDLAKPETISLEVDLSVEKLRRGDYRLETAAISAVWKNGVLTLPRFDLRDSVGRLQLAANFDTLARTGEAQLRSGIDLPGLAKTLGLGDAGDLKFQSIPQVELTARLTVREGRPQWLVYGRLSVGQFLYGKVPFDRFHSDVSWDGKRWAVRDFLLRHRTGGELRGDAQQDFNEAGKGDFRLGLVSTLNPESLAPLATKFAPKVATRLAMMRFYDAPKITLSARGPTPLDSVASGDLVMGHVSYRNMESLSTRASLRYNGRVLYVDDFLIKRTEGIAGGALAFDFPAELVYLKQIRTGVIPIEVAWWVDPTLVPDIKPYRFGKKAPTLLIDGVVDQRKPGPRTQVNVSVDAPTLNYTFCGKDLHFTNVSAKLVFLDEKMNIGNMRAVLYGGTVKGDAEISLLKGRPGHEADIRFTDVDFSSLTKLYFDYDESQGKLNAKYRFTGKSDEGRAMKGEGEMAVTEGNVFAIPFLGPLSDILNKIVPGMGYNKARRASATFTIDDGIINTKDFVIEGKGFSMIGDGRIWFLEDRMDFDMRINAQGVPGVLLFPVSKLFEYRARSSFSQPDWRPKVIPTLRPAERKEKEKENPKAGPAAPSAPERPRSGPATRPERATRAERVP